MSLDVRIEEQFGRAPALSTDTNEESVAVVQGIEPQRRLLWCAGRENKNLRGVWEIKNKPCSLLN